MRYVKLLLLASVIFSCGPNYHLKKSSYHLNKAIEKGAKVSSDTVYKVIPFKFPGASFSTVLKPEFKNTEVKVNKNGIDAEVKLKLKQECPDDCVDSVYVYVKCPDIEEERKVPASINNTVVTPRGFWYYSQFMGLTFIAGFVIRHYIRTILSLLFRLKPF